MIQAFGATVKGLHLENQDAYYLGKHLFAVADGVTISGGGKAASTAAIGQLQNHDALPKLFRRAQEAVQGGPGATTLTIAHILPEQLEIGHVGDSAAYLVRDTAKKLTTDDVEKGTNKLTQALGQGPVTPHFAEYPLQPRDVIILATDGVSKHVSLGELVQIVRTHELKQIPGELIARATEKRKLYEDDKTVVVIQV